MSAYRQNGELPPHTGRMLRPYGDRPSAVYVLNHPDPERDLNGYIFGSALHAREWMIRSVGDFVLEKYAVVESREQCRCCGEMHLVLGDRLEIIEVPR